MEKEIENNQKEIDLQELATFSEEYLENMKMVYEDIDLERQFEEANRVRFKHLELMIKMNVVGKISDEILNKYEILLQEKEKCEENLSSSISEREYWQDRLNKINLMISKIEDFFAIDSKAFPDKEQILTNLRTWAAGAKVREKISKLDDDFPLSLLKSETLVKMRSVKR